MVFLVKSAMNNKELTDIAFENKVSKSQISKLLYKEAIPVICVDILFPYIYNI